MIKIHNLGFSRLGENRELKFALERFWRGEIEITELTQIATKIRHHHWHLQASAGLDFIPVGDFSYYDHVLDTSVMLGVVPQRFNHSETTVSLETYFNMARGYTKNDVEHSACAMVKWFDTNYHYIVPELAENQTFTLSTSKLFDETAELQALGYNAKPVVLGILSWLWLAKTITPFEKLNLLERLLPIYSQILTRLAEQGVEWVQIDEPILTLDLPVEWKNAFERVYNVLQNSGVKILLTTYFGDLADNNSLVCKLPVAGLHIDIVRTPAQLTAVLDHFANHKVLSLGLIDGRNIWRADLAQAFTTIEQVRERFQGELWLAPSCSLLHVPIDLELETKLNPTIKTWLAFAKQKLTELEILRLTLVEGVSATENELRESKIAIESRKNSTLIHNPQVQQRLQTIDDENLAKRENVFAIRDHKQRAKLNLPDYPTTTIGSFPQTSNIRKARADYKKGILTLPEYEAKMKENIALAVSEQEAIGLDVFVHGEAERNDMVEYFGEQLEGFLFTVNGWVQSYGSRCVKPPIIYGDVSRPEAMTVRWSVYAQSLTDKPMKGMLTGPVTILNWSFVRNDQPRFTTAYQIALALRDEVVDLEKAGIPVIQIDEPAFREGLPLRKADWDAYLKWSVKAFRISSCGVQDTVQIHTHMCYSEFNDVIQAIADLDADVITIETSRSDMKLLGAFIDFAYPNGIGPGVYDIHSPNIPKVSVMVDLLNIARSRIPFKQLWVNPDCGLKTRQWDEVRPALVNMVQAAKLLREEKA